MEFEDYKKCLEEAKRVHILLTPQSLEHVATFLVSSLLLSHGIRKDTVSIVKLSKLWLCAPGSSLRHLRPDLDSSVGWVKAVLRNRKREVLGSVKLRDLPSFDRHGFERFSVLCSSQGKEIIKNEDVWWSMFSGYKGNKILVEYSERGDVMKANKVFTMEISCKYAPVLINISLDRIEEGKKPVFNFKIKKS